jgi:hypothetical protein
MSPGRLSSILSLFLLATLTAAELPVTAPATGPAPFRRTRPRIASDGRGFLAIWTDRRGEADPDHGDVRAARLDEAGNVLDPFSIVVKPLGNTAADVASNGDGYLVATVTALGTTELTAISASGEMRDVARIASARNPALASNGRDYLLVYQGGFGPAIQDFDIYAQRLNANGALRGERVLIAQGASDPIVASNGSEYAIGSFDITGSYATILGEDGIRVPRVQLTPNGLQPYAGRDKMSVASDGTDFLFVWAEGRGLLNSAVWKMQTFGRRLRRGGELDAIQQYFPDEAPVQGDPSVAWIGDRYLITFTSNLQRPDPDLAAVEAARDGTRLREPFTIAGQSDRQTSSDLAWNGRDAQIVFVDTVRFAITGPLTAADDIRHLRYGEAESALLSESLTWQDAPAAIALGDDDLVVWSEPLGREHRWTVFAGRANAATGPLDGRGIVLRATADDQLHPALSDAPQPLAVWIEQTTTGPALVYAKLPLGKGEAFLLGEAVRDARPAVAWNGSLHSVLWESPAHRIVALRLTADGRPLGAPLAVSPAGKFATEPQLVSDGERSFLAWITFEEEPLCVIIECLRSAINVQAVDASLQPFGPATVVATSGAVTPRLVWNGEELAVFYAGSDPADQFARIGLRALRVDRNGIPLDAGGRLLSDAATAVTAAVWDGQQYIAAAEARGASPLIVRASRELLPISASPLDVDARKRTNVVITLHGGAPDLVYQRKDDVMRLQLRRWTFLEVPRRRAR